jgi:uncharacterized protein YjbI with pentapeptide repeats
MRVVKPVRLGVLHRTYPYGGKRHLGVAVLAMVPLRPPEAGGPPRELSTEMAMWTFLADRLAPGGILDEGFVKPRGEVLVRGSCFAPNGQPVTETFCRVKVGDAPNGIDAAVRVTGDRVWLGDEPSKPQPFTVMPLDDTRALGGEADLENPHGKGLAPVQTEHGELHPLPNVEDPAEPVRSPSHRPLPAGLGPVGLGSPSRRDQAGTYDERWLETRFPGLAEDASPDVLQMARPRQRLREGFFRGGETIAIWNMHPALPLLEGAAPELVARAFIRRRARAGASGAVATDTPGVSVAAAAAASTAAASTAAASTAAASTTAALTAAPLEPVHMHLETLHVFPDADVLVALYRGAIPVDEPDASDVELLCVAAESPSAPRDLAHYTRVVASRVGKGAEKNVLAFLRDDELLPPASEWGATGMPKEELSRALEREDLAGKRMRVRRDRMVAEQREAIRASGQDPDAILPLPPPEPAAPSLDDPAALADRVAALTTESEEKQKELEARRVAMDEEARRAFAEAGLDWEAEKKKALREAAGPPKPLADGLVRRVHEAIASARALGGSLGELETMAADPKWEAGLRERDAQRLELYRRSAHLGHPADALDGDAASIARARVQAALDAGEPLGGLDLTGADLRGLDLHGRDLRGALLEAARLEGANLDGADLTGAVLCRASLEGTTFRGTKLDDANLGDTTLAGAVLDDASLRKATLMRARLDGASLRGADLDGTLLLEVSFGAVDLTDARLAKVTFLRADLRGVKLAGAAMEQAQLVECDASGVDLTGANIRSSVWVDTRASGARLVDANLTQAALTKGIDLSGANLSGATIDRGSLRTADLTGAQLVGARLRQADLSEAKARGARLDHADARGALLVRTDLARASLRSASFLDALLTSADLRGADATDAVFFQADLALVHTDDATRWDGAITERSNSRPRREDPGDPSPATPVPAPRAPGGSAANEVAT